MPNEICFCLTETGQPTQRSTFGGDEKFFLELTDWNSENCKWHQNQRSRFALKNDVQEIKFDTLNALDFRLNNKNPS